MKIHKLSSLLISKIAAGEVIERPSFAIKELIENSIDAKATAIKIYIEESGLRKIQVVDNGEGMSEEDVREAWKPHTTSKIDEESELYSIKSFGFRGEALSSLAAISTLTVQSRREEDATGFAVVVKEGKLVKASVIGMPIGTIVTAQDLFASIPARKKFLNSPQAELRQMLDVVNNFAIAHPSVHFTFLHGKRVLLDYPPTKDVAERVEQFLGNAVSSFFIPVKKENSYVKIRGFIAKPQMHAGNQNKQYIFVNSRKVNNKIISTAAKEAYGTMLESATYPIFVLFLSLPFEMVDINVHPRKEQVAFLNNEFMFQTVKEVVVEVLAENNITFQNLSWKKMGAGMTKSFAATILKENVLDKESFGEERHTKLIQLDKVYIIFADKGGLVLYDQHAVHERILFEKLRDEFLKQRESLELYELPMPVSLGLTTRESILFKEHKRLLEKVGFMFKRKEVVKMPFIFKDRNPKGLIMKVLEDIEANLGVLSIDKVTEEMIAFLACRAAVKAGDVLTEEQMKKLIMDLGKTANNTTCPHGRPTRVFMSLDQLNAMFKRN